jgi:hypothetical protein
VFVLENKYTQRTTVPVLKSKHGGAFTTYQQYGVLTSKNVALNPFGTVVLPVVAGVVIVLSVLNSEFIWSTWVFVLLLLLWWLCVWCSSGLPLSLLSRSL